MAKFRKCLLAVVLSFIAILAINPLQVQAKNPSLVKLKLGKTYTKYDVTGDKRNDKVKITQQKIDEYEYSYKLYVSINGKKHTLTNKWGFFDVNPSIVTLKNGKTYLWIQGFGDDDSDPFMCLYQYKGGKLLKAVTFSSNGQANYAAPGRTDITKISGNTITVKQNAMSTPLGVMGYSYNYTYKNGKIAKKSNIGKILWVAFDNGKQSRTGVLKNTKTLYTSPSFKKKVMSIKAGQRATATEIYITKNMISVKLKIKNGKSGWVKCSKTYNDKNLIFRNCFYAG